LTNQRPAGTSRSKWAGYAVGTVLQAVLTDGIATEASASSKIVAAEARADEILNAAQAVEEVAKVDRVADPVISKPAELEGARFGERSTAWKWADQH
jgi:ADP-ribosylglycohydrolase/ADP-ribosyltransferase exoenzyme